MRERLTYANVTATIALFIALAGGAYAATKLPKNSVGPSQLKKNAVTAAKVDDGAVTTTKLGNGAVTRSKVDLASLGAVPEATHATSADTATHASSADNATHAGDAGTLGGLPSSAFLPASRMVTGAASVKAKNTILTVPDVFGIETFTNTSSKFTLNVFSDSGAWTIATAGGVYANIAPFIYTIEFQSNAVESVLLYNSPTSRVYSVQCAAQVIAGEVACTEFGG